MAVPTPLVTELPPRNTGQHLDIQGKTTWWGLNEYIWSKWERTDSRWTHEWLWGQMVNLFVPIIYQFNKYSSFVKQKRPQMSYESWVINESPSILSINGLSCRKSKTLSVHSCVYSFYFHILFKTFFIFVLFTFYNFILALEREKLSNLILPVTLYTDIRGILFYSTLWSSIIVHSLESKKLVLSLTL